jgi:hypothetical protein
MSGWDEMISRMDQLILPRDEKDFVWWLVTGMILLVALHIAEGGRWKRIGDWVKHALSEKCPYCRGIEFEPVKQISALQRGSLFIVVWACYCPDCKSFFRRTCVLDLSRSSSGNILLSS